MKQRFIVTFAGAIACVVAGAASVRAENTVTFTSWGGSFQDGVRKSILTPTAEKLGLTIKEDTTHGTADLRAQITAKAVSWDVVQYSLDECSMLSKAGMLEPLDYSKINTGGIPKALVQRDWIGFINYSKVIAWQKSKFGDDGPKNWADFWDIKRFPGSRALYNKVNDALEVALLADGVPQSEVYNVLSTDAGVDRGFRKLEQIAPYVRVWYTGGSQSSQLMKDGEIDIIQMSNNRIEAINQDGAKVGYTFNQGVIEGDCLLIPKGAPNKSAAMQLINEAVSAPRQAEMTKVLHLGPINASVFDGGAFTPEDLKRINTSAENLSRQLIIDPAFYVSRIVKLQERFDALMQK
jgi:putative spermidine/putrescine transport system substrate-binding protein